MIPLMKGGSLNLVAYALSCKGFKFHALFITSELVGSYQIVCFSSIGLGKI